MPHEFVHTTTLARRLALGVAASSLLTLAACSGETSSQRAGFPMAEVPRFNQPPPDKPLLGQPVITAEQVMPHAKGDPHEPLPAAAPLPARASEPASGSGATNKEDAGGVNPAANAASAAHADLQALATAFMEGAGLNPAKTHFEVTPEFMRTFGEALRIAVQGTIDLLAARSEIKREFRAGVTIIATGANNPLKFLPNSEGVLMQMVHQTFPGFMKPLPAMQDAFQDLHVHQLALMAGIRAAYAEALTRFDPTELERRTETNPGLLDKLLTNGRKAALWDDYKHNFDVLRRHAEDDLMAFSGRTFVEAYENAEQSVKGQP